MDVRKYLWPSLLLGWVFASFLLTAEADDSPSIANSVAKRFEAQAVRARALEKLSEISKSVEPKRFRLTCEKIADAIVRIQKDFPVPGNSDPEKIAAGRQLADKVCDEIANELFDSSLGLTDSESNSFRNALDAAFAEYKRNGIEGFKGEFSQWKTLFDIVVRALRESSLPPNQVASKEVAESGAAELSKNESSGLAAKLYDRLEAVGVVYYDDAFRETCKKVSDALKAKIEELDRSELPEARVYKQAVTGAMVTAILATTEGDDQAREAWKKALIDIHNRLGIEIEAADQSTSSAKAWRNAYQSLIKGFLTAIEADRKAYSAGARGDASSSGTGGTSSSGNSHASVWHARMMKHIELKHERRSSRIQGINAR